MTDRRKEQGFSLIELLVTALVGGILLVGVFTFLGRATQKASAYLETSEMDERRNVFGDLLRRDLDSAGSNILYSPLVSGGLVDGLFGSTGEYTASPGSVTKTGPDGYTTSTILTTSIVSGEGYLEYTPPPSGSMVYLNSVYNNSYRLIYLDAEDKSGTANIYIMEDGWNCVARPSPHHDGDAYRIAIEPDAARGRVINYYRVRNTIPTLLYTSAADMLIYPVAATACLPAKDSTITGVKFFASVMSDSQIAAAQIPPLPYDMWTGDRLRGPLTEFGGGPLDGQLGYIILSGDRRADPVYTQTDFSAEDGKVKLNPPARGTYAAGNYVLLVDRRPGASASALFQVQAVTAGGKGYYFTLERVTKETPAWGRLFSDETDFSHSFAAGSVLLRLAPPVTYAFTQDGRVVRSESYLTKDSVAAENKATALLGVSDFNITDTSAPTDRSYMASVTLSTEGYETGATTQTYTYKATPRALNGAPDWTRLLPQN